MIVDAATAPLMREIAPDVQQVAMPDLVECLETDLTVTARPDDIAVIFYTSGSTGEPKGVYQDQRSILYEVLRHCWRAGLCEEDAVALLYSPSVSGSTRDIYGSLAAGARLCIVDVKRMGLGETTRALADWRVSVLHSIPGLFRTIFASDGEDPRRLAKSVRLVHLISDRVLRSDVALYRDRFPRPCRLCIDLATTETYSYASWYLDHDTVLDGQSVPVGYPRPDIAVQVLDDRGQAVAAGELGEIVVGGRALSLGYWRDEALTRLRFTASASDPGMREFRTGDMGRLLPNGLLEFVGRKDRQIKLRGNTVHLAEVETIMAGCPGVAEAVAVARGDTADIKLVVYYAADPGVTAEIVRDWSAAHLAPSTQPSEIVRIDALPRLPSGKPDYVGLKKLDAARTSAAFATGPGSAAAPIPASAAMRAVCDGWKELLEPGAFDADVAFGDAGGDSLKGLKLLLFLEGRLKRKLRTDLLDMETRPSDLIDRLVRPPAHATDGVGDVHDDRPVLFIFAGLFGPDIPTVDFGRRAECLFSPVLVDYQWAGDDFTGTFDADRLFDEVLAIAGRAGEGRSLWLLGHSFGGKLAAEASRRLLAAGMPVDFVGVLDGLPSNASLKRHQPLPPREPLLDRIRHGVARNGGLINYICMGAAKPLGAWFASRRHYRLLGWTLWMARRPFLAEAGFRLRRSVMATVRLAAFAPMPLGPVATGLRLFLSTGTALRIRHSTRRLAGKIISTRSRRR